MKKFSVLPVLLILFLSTGTAQEIKREFNFGLITPTHQEQDRQFIYGKVKEIHYSAYHAKEVDGKIVRGDLAKPSESRANVLRQFWSYYFNEDGQVVKLAAKDDDYQTNFLGIVHYDDGQLDRIYWLSKDTLQVYQTFSYLEGNEIEKKVHNINNNQLVYRTVHSLDENGQVIRLQHYLGNGQKGMRVEMKRDENGNNTFRQLINSDGTVTYEQIHEYDDEGNKVSTHNTIFGGEKVDTKSKPGKREYDQYGNWTKFIPNNPNGFFIERSFVFYE